MSKLSNEELETKLGQAYQVIGQLLEDAAFTSVAGQAALDYFSSDTFDKDFLPWPKLADDLETQVST